MKNGIIHTIRTHINAFIPLFFESLYTQTEMEANITSNTKTNSGDIIMIYYDNIPDIGAVFTFYNTTTGDGVYAGFGQEIEHDPLFIRYISDDSPAIFNYNISFFKPDLVRRYSFNLTNT